MRRSQNTCSSKTILKLSSKIKINIWTESIWIWVHLHRTDCLSYTVKCIICFPNNGEEHSRTIHCPYDTTNDVTWCLWHVRQKLSILLQGDDIWLANIAHVLSWFYSVIVKMVVSWRMWRTWFRRKNYVLCVVCSIPFLHSSSREITRIQIKIFNPKQVAAPGSISITRYRLQISSWIL